MRQFFNIKILKTRQTLLTAKLLSLSGIRRVTEKNALSCESFHIIWRIRKKTDEKLATGDECEASV
jgi:hypothetical protein